MRERMWPSLTLGALLLVGTLSVGALSLGVSGLVAEPVAGAQTTGYPPPAGITVVVNGEVINIPIGGTATLTMGGFPANTLLVFTINGVFGGNATTDGNGYVTFTVSVTDPHISINGGPAVAVPMGTSTITLTAATVVQTFGVNLAASTTPTTVTPTAASGGSTSSGGTVGSGSALAFTGADIAATVVGGVVLLALGTAIVIATRRRSVPRPRSAEGSEGG